MYSTSMWEKATLDTMSDGSKSQITPTSAEPAVERYPREHPRTLLFSSPSYYYNRRKPG